MPARVRSLLPKRWRDAAKPDTDLAEAEGLAAGLGLLTGTVARTSGRSTIAHPCPECGGHGEITVVDLVLGSTTVRCSRCEHQWTVAGEPERSRPH